MRSKRDSPWAAVAFLLVSVVGIIVVSYVHSLSSRVTKIERLAPQVTKIERQVSHEKTLLVALRAAGPKELRKLRAAARISVGALQKLLRSPAVRRKLHVVTVPQHHRHRVRHHRKRGHRAARIPTLKPIPPTRLPASNAPQRTGGGGVGSGGPGNPHGLHGPRSR